MSSANWIRRRWSTKKKRSRLPSLRLPPRCRRPARAWKSNMLKMKVISPRLGWPWIWPGWPCQNTRKANTSRNWKRSRATSRRCKPISRPWKTSTRSTSAQPTRATHRWHNWRNSGSASNKNGFCWKLKKRPCGCSPITTANTTSKRKTRPLQRPCVNWNGCGWQEKPHCSSSSPMSKPVN